MNAVERRRELGEPLRQRRGLLRPEEVGLGSGARRRAPGLRREEIAQLAGIGPSWYTWLEQGRDIHPSTPPLAASSLAQVLEGFTAFPAVIYNRRFDVLTANRAAHAIYGQDPDTGSRWHRNMLWRFFMERDRRQMTGGHSFTTCRRAQGPDSKRFAA